MSKPTLSWVILSATAFVIALVLLIWLLLWMSRPRAGIEGWWVAQRGLALPVIGHQAEDLGRIVRTSGATPPRDLGYQALEESLRHRLASAGTRPVVISISAAGVSDDQGGYLLRPEPGSLAQYSPAGSRQSLLSVERLVDLFGEYPSRKKLLILDAGQVGSDRDLGVFANGFLHRLKSYLETKRPRGLAILCSSAPGQLSWTSEADRCSVFGSYVALGMSGKATSWDPSGRGLTVRGLHNYVRAHVKAWVAANRQAEQTPELLGDPEVNFPLPRAGIVRGAVANVAEKRAGGLSKRLDEGWVRRDTLQGRRPYRHTPLLWQQYLETLLRAERLIRVGDYDEAEDSLENLPGLEKKIVDAAGGLPMDPFWSLGLLERHLADHPDAAQALSTEWGAANGKVDQALKGLVGGTEEAEPSVEEKPRESAEAETRRPAEAEATKAAEAGTKDDATPPAGGVAPNRSTKDAVTPPRSPTPARAKPKGESVSSALVARADDFRPQYVEAQVLLWADTFARRDLAPYRFEGPRGDLLGDALRTRRLAEKAAASDERISRWIAPLVEAGDALRRRAQDGLFSGDTGRFEALARLLEQARERYRKALDVADHASQALDLVEQVEAELPFYGEWKARRGLRRGEGLDQDFVDLMKATASLARSIQAELPGGPPVSDEGDDPLAAHLAHVGKWEARSQELKAAFDRMRDEFQEHCAGLAASGGSGRWREIDAALVVPLIQVEVRRRLLQAVRSSTAAGTLAGPGAAAPPPSASRATSLRGYARERTERAYSTERTTRREEDVEAPSPAGDPSGPDPEFWRLALRLARLEWGLFEIGGASQTDLDRLSDAYESARNSTRSAPGLAFDAFSKLSDLLRGLRAERSRAIWQSRGQAYAPLSVADRALRVVPLADALGLSDKPVEALDRYDRHELLLWHGNRLLHDFAPGHALRLFENARQFLETEPLRAAIEADGSMARAKISVTPEPSESLIIDDWSEKPMRVGLDVVGNVPVGDATVLVGFDPAQPVSVTEKASRSSAREGILVPVRADRSSDRVGYAVGRTESIREPVTLALNPVAFYRGRFFGADAGVSVTLSRANDPVKVTIQQSYEGLKFKDFTDQFKEHPGQGYLHYGTNLQYKLELTTDRPMKLVVRYGLQEHTDSYKTRTLEIGPKKKGEIIEILKGNDFPIVKADELLNVAPLNLLVTIWKDRENGEVQGRARYTFRMIPPSRYISTLAEFDPSTRMLNLWVTHLANDPVTGPVEIFASIGGGDAKAWIRRSRIAPFSFHVPPATKSVTWRVGIESMPAAFRETIETPVPPPAGTGAAPPQ
jgi:hypothetical protein